MARKNMERKMQKVKYYEMGDKDVTLETYIHELDHGLSMKQHQIILKTRYNPVSSMKTEN